MAKLRHPSIITFKEVYKTISRLCIVMEYADGISLLGIIGGDLAQAIKRTDRHMKETKILDWFTQMCLAVKHCHDRKVIHRDLKTSNIFLTMDGRVKLGDFGIARLLSHTREKVNTMVGTPYYLAPELLENKPYSFKCDIWSLGIILYEVRLYLSQMCCKVPPFNGESLH